MSIFNRKKQKDIIVVGCGTLGAKLADVLHKQYDNVTIIDLDEQSFSKLSNSSDYILIKGDASDIDVLENAGIMTADIMIVTTCDDNVNIMIAEIAKQYYKVKKVIACVKNITKEFAYKQTGIEVISPVTLLIDEIQNILEEEKEGVIT
ncbi:MAG: potassium channel family protein [Saccharofermentanales bacterium]